MQFDHNILVTGSWDKTCLVCMLWLISLCVIIVYMLLYLHQVWDVVHFNVLAELQGHTERVSCLKFNDSVL